MKKLFKEAVLIILTAIPFIYLFTIWGDLPDKVATHFNLSGEADGWSEKTMLPYLLGGIGFGMYLLLLAIPLLDPKKKIEEMGEKYYSLRVILAVFFAALNIFILYSAKVGGIENTSLIFLLMGGLFLALGNYFQAVRPNYFVGIRTPWTLQNEDVWKKTHRVGGRIWMLGGLLIIAVALMPISEVYSSIIFGSILAIIVIVPIVHSYLEFKKLDKSLKA